MTIVTPCNVIKEVPLYANYAILIKYNYQSAKGQALHESTVIPTGLPDDNLPNSNTLGDDHGNIPESIELVYWWPWPCVGIWPVVTRSPTCNSGLEPLLTWPITSNMVALDGQFGLQQYYENNSGSSNNGSRTAAGTGNRSGNMAINIISHMGIVTLLLSSHFLVLGRFITILHSMWQTPVRNQPPALAYHFQVFGESVKDMTSTRVVMAWLKCSPCSSSQGKGHHVQVYWKCVHNCQNTIQSIGQHLPALLFHLDLLPVRQGDPPWTFQ